jgi:hypothetical protein
MTTEERIFDLLWGLGQLLDKHYAGIVVTEEGDLSLMLIDTEADDPNDAAVEVPFESTVISSSVIIEALAASREGDSETGSDEDIKKRMLN